MIADKIEISKKMIKQGNIKYSICNKEINVDDIKALDFEYCKNGTHENYAHSRCLTRREK